MSSDRPDHFTAVADACEASVCQGAYNGSVESAEVLRYSGAAPIDPEALRALTDKVADAIHATSAAPARRSPAAAPMDAHALRELCASQGGHALFNHGARHARGQRGRREAVHQPV